MACRSLLTRIYLESRCYDVRYVNLDEGQSYLVYTDDPVALSACGDRETLLPELKGMLHRYDDLFSALTALMYLPVYFIARQAEVVSTRFSTELNAQKNSAKVKRAFRVLGKQAVALHRQVKCLAGQSSSAWTDTQEVKPPELRSVSEGFWKELEPFEFGEDQEGNPIAGRTYDFYAVHLVILQDVISGRYDITTPASTGCRARCRLFNVFNQVATFRDW